MTICDNDEMKMEPMEINIPSINVTLCDDISMDINNELNNNNNNDSAITIATLDTLERMLDSRIENEATKVEKYNYECEPSCSNTISSIRSNEYGDNDINDIQLPMLMQTTATRSRHYRINNSNNKANL